ncbi:MAG: hypothetical protein ACI9QQ_000853 [Myxococcota bacterium]|jgi:hypothetical protein
MSAGAIDGGARPGSIAVATIRKANDQIKTEGQQATKLLEGAAQVAKNASGDSERGRIIDIRA